MDMRTIFFTILFHSSIGANAFLEPYHDYVTSLTDCVVKIVVEYERQVVEKTIDITVMNMNNGLQLSELHQVKGARFISRQFFWDTNNISDVIYIVMSEDYQELASGLNKVSSDQFWNPSARFIIVVMDMKEYSFHNLTDLLHTYNIFKVSVISRYGNEYAIYKHNFTKPGACLRAGRLTFWCRCTDYCSGKLLPPLSSGSIRGCRYKFIAHNLWPFTNFDSAIKGTEQYFFTLFEKYYGVKIEIQEYNKVDKYGKPFDNVSQIMLKKVAHNKFEGALGGYSVQQMYSGNITHAYPYKIDHVFYVLAHSNFVDPWLAMLKQCSWIFCGVVIVFVCFCILARIFAIFHTPGDVSRNALIVFGYLLNKYVLKRTPSGYASALAFSILMFTSFILPYTIQAKLYSLTARPIRGFEPKVASDLENFQAVLHADWVRRYLFVGYRVCPTRLSCLQALARRTKTLQYTITSNSYYQVYRWKVTDEHCNFVTYTLQEPFTTVLRAIYLRRGSVLLEPLKRLTLQVADTSLLKKYELDIAKREMMLCKSHEDVTFMPASLEKLYFAFIVLIVGCCLSLLLFICEVCAG